MYSLLVRIMVLAALLELGISLADLENCLGRKCVIQLQERSHDILKINWKPISVFPGEARRFSDVKATQ